MIRKATLADKPLLLQLLHDFYRETDYYFLGWNEASTSTLIDNLVTNDNATLLVNDEVTGCIGGCVVPFWMNNDKLICQELFWYVDKSTRGSKVAVGLFKAFEAWAKDQGAAFIAMSSTTNLDPTGVGAFYNRKGYKASDISYIKEVT